MPGHGKGVHRPISPASSASSRLRQPGFAEFVTLIAALMAMTALAIDSMLPALPAIGADLGVESANDRQWVISAFVLGMGLGQIVHGPLSDRFGRRPVLLGSLALGLICNLVAATAGSFALLVAARVASGLVTASSRVLAVSIVRDRFAGAEMARVMSLATIVFLAAPILAPSIGQLILLVAPWRAIFAVLAAAGLAVMLWAGLRLPETLPPDRRVAFSLAALGRGFAAVIGNRIAIGYTLAGTLLLGALYGYILSVQQIFETVFHAPALFPAVFAATAAAMGVAAYLNSRIVTRLGPRHVSHRALAGYVVLAAVHLAISMAGHESLISFALLQAAALACFGLATANMTAIAMEPMGRIAGMASSVQGLIQILAGAGIGIVIGQAFDGTTRPLFAGAVIAGLAALAIIALAERGRLFRPA